MPDPYETLGLSPTARPADAEAAFRRLLKEAHPDRHVGGSATEIAEAERRTRELTDAINAVRGGWRPSMRDPGAWNERYGFVADPDTDWFGNPVASRGRAGSGATWSSDAHPACPLCGAPCGSLAELESHLATRHPTAARGRGSARWQRFLRWLRFLPAPSLSLLVPLVVWWMLVVQLAPPAIERVGIWVGVIGFLVLRGLAHHAQRTRL